MKLDDFRKNLGNVVRPNRFIVTVTPPSAFTNKYGSGYDLANLKYRVKSTEIPSRSIGEFEYKYYGLSLKLPGDTNYGDFNITFINENTWKTRSLFEDWQSLILTSMDNSKEFAINILFDSKILIEQYDAKGDTAIAAYEFFSVYPKEVGSIELSMETANTVEEFQVTFGYSHWERK